jgi:hypothetical protein
LGNPDFLPREEYGSSFRCRQAAPALKKRPAWPGFLKIPLRLPIYTPGEQEVGIKNTKVFGKVAGRRMDLGKCRERLCGAAGIVFLVGMLLPPFLWAEKIGEGNIKAVFLLNFIKFVEWPASTFKSPKDPILLYVLGKDATSDSVLSMNGRTVSGRRLIVLKAPNLASVERCHVLFVGASEKEDMEQILGAMGQWPVLTVSDIEGFAGRGGMIGFIRRESRVGFEVNEGAARKTGLKVDAKLLYLGKNVQGIR